jgi:SAM-dependent methyltransferase
MKRCLRCEAAYDSDGWRCPGCGRSPAIRDGIPTFAPSLEAENQDYTEEAFDKLFLLEAGNFWFQARNQLIAWAFRRHFPNARSLFELGCGTGFVLHGLSRAFPAVRLTGADLFTRALECAGSRVPGASLIQVDARRLPFRDEFDVVAAFDVIEHIDEDEAVLAEMCQATRPGGGLLLTVPQHPFLWSCYDEYGHHKRRYTREELVRKVRRAGLQVEYATSFVSLLLPLMLASRLRQKKKPTEGYDPHAELRIHPWLNAALGGALSLERLLIRCGLTMPMGGSLLLAARRPAVSAQARRIAA